MSLGSIALKKFHSVRLSDKGVKEIVNKTLRENGDEIPESLEQHGVFGGPHTGFVNGGLALLHCIMERRQLKKPFCTVETIVDSPDIKVQSNFQEFGLVTLKKSDIDLWPGETVFCHNDLTPRNIILRKHDPSSGKATRKLAGIIDWELAGFYPASYELSLQDTYLGANRHLSFYVLLKEHMQKLVPRFSSQIVLLQAMELIFESQQRSLLEGTNVPAHIRKRLMEKLKMVRHKDPYVGWTRSQRDEPFPDSAAIQKLEDDVVKEMAARKKSIKQHKNDGPGKV